MQFTVRWITVGSYGTGSNVSESFKETARGGEKFKKLVSVLVKSYTQIIQIIWSNVTQCRTYSKIPFKKLDKKLDS